VSAIVELQKILPPPADPKFVLDAAGMEEFRRLAACPLPESYVEFVRVYGIGYVRTERCELPFLRVYSPSIIIEQNRAFYQALSAMPPDSRRLFPFPDWMQPDGHILWGSSCDGHNYAWVRRGPSSSWPIAVHDRYSDAIDCFVLGLAEFLLAVLERRIHPAGVPDAIQDEAETNVWVDCDWRPEKDAPRHEQG
jgi:hypothetical protein